MICARCGRPDLAESAYCSNCGAPLTPPLADETPNQTSETVPPTAEATPEPTAFSTVEDSPTLRIAPIFSPAEAVADPAASIPTSAPVSVAEMPTEAATDPVAAMPVSVAEMPTEAATDPVAAMPVSVSDMPTEAYSELAASMPESAPVSVSDMPTGEIPVVRKGSVITAVLAGPATEEVAQPATVLMDNGGAGYMQPGEYIQYPYPAVPDASGIYAPGFQSGAYGPLQSAETQQPGWPGVFTAVTPPPKPPSRLIKPLPLLAVIGGIVLGAILLVVLFFFSGSDWAAGTQNMALCASILGGLIVVVFLVRAALGLLARTNIHRRMQIVCAFLLALLLFVVALLGFTQQSTVHSMQGRFLEGHQQWANAISEYQAAGESAPMGTDIADSYNGWGEQLQAQQDYAPALDKFDLVINNYTQVAAQVQRAETDEVATYLKLGSLAVQQNDYKKATGYYDTLLKQSFCALDSTCVSKAAEPDAAAYLKLGRQQSDSQDYSDAANSFLILTTDHNLAQTDEAKQAHPYYATALWGLAQQTLTTNCATSLPTYQQLASGFADTTEGEKAATALKQPVPVKGHFTQGVPSGSSSGAVGLMQGVTAQTTTDQFFAILNKSPLVPVGSDGSFTFKSIKQGTYGLTWGTIDSASGSIIFYGKLNDGTFIYNATVGPLCAYNFDNLDEPFPTA